MVHMAARSVLASVVAVTVGVAPAETGLPETDLADTDLAETDPLK